VAHLTHTARDDGATGTERPADAITANPRRAWDAWLLAWTGGAVLAVGNGTLRELGLRRVLDDESARQVSTVTLLILLTGWVWWLERRWPLASTAVALRVGAIWVALTVAFEFGFGHYVEHTSWQTLLADYDLTTGRTWLVVPVWTLAAPAVVRGVRRRLSRR